LSQKVGWRVAAAGRGENVRWFVLEKPVFWVFDGKAPVRSFVVKVQPEQRRPPVKKMGVWGGKFAEAEGAEEGDRKKSPEY